MVLLKRVVANTFKRKRIIKYFRKAYYSALNVLNRKKNRNK